ncbi:helix-turn-helix domain-containing protein [Ruegeria arenilitoris]|uniref:helix-turn-helix domain-containing protein n=1 Tax=Ruegeria arenilitoris TaxID=1173585 RepID=UPI00147AB533|nr:helix-turn-helix domain-containing protein [Ruegeria arenilitoris]
MSDIEPNKQYTLPEVAEILQINIQTIQAKVRHKAIPHQQYGPRTRRILGSDLIDYINQSKVEVVGKGAA